MNGMYTWASSAIYSSTIAAYQKVYDAITSAPQATYDFTTGTYTGICQAASGTVSIAYDSVDYIEQSFKQFWEGFTRCLNLTITKVPELMTYSKMREMFIWSLAMNLGVTVLSRYAYQTVVKPSVEKIPYAGPILADYVLEIVAVLWFQRWAITMTANNFFHGMNISKATIDDMERARLENKKKNPDSPEPENYYKACGHGSFPAVQAVGAIPIYRFGNWLTVKALIATAEYYLHLGKYAQFLMESELYGQNIVGDKIRIEEVCSDHYFETLSRNNWFTLGVGMAFLGSYELLVKLISYETKINNDYINDAILAVWSHYNGAITQLANNPLPGKTKGWDLSYYPRYAMQEFIRNRIVDAVDYLHNPVSCDFLFLGSLPNDDDIKNLPGQSKTAFIVVGDRLYFLDKQALNTDASNRKLKMVDINQKQFETLCQEIKKITVSEDDYNKLQADFEQKDISEEEREDLRRKINHVIPLKKITSCNYIEALPYDAARMIETVTGFSHPHLPNNWPDTAKKIAAFPPVNLMKNILVEKRLQSLEGLVTKPEFNAFIDLYGVGYNNTFETLMYYRNDVFTGLANYMPDKAVSPDLKQFINYILDHALDGVFENLNRKVYARRARLAAKHPIKTLDEAKNQLRLIADMIKAHKFELHGGGVVIGNKEYTSSVVFILRWIEEVAGLNSPPLTIEKYNEVVMKIIIELANKTYVTNGVLGTGWGSRDNSTVRLYKDIIMHCIEMDGSKNTNKYTSKKKQSRLPEKTLPSVEPVHPLSEIKNDTQATTLSKQIEDARQHMMEIFTLIRKQEFKVTGGGKTLFWEPDKKYPDTAYDIIMDLYRGLSIDVFSVLVHNEVMKRIQGMLDAALNEKKLSRDPDTTKFYQSLRAKCVPVNTNIVAPDATNINSNPAETANKTAGKDCPLVIDITIPSNQKPAPAATQSVSKQSKAVHPEIDPDQSGNTSQLLLNSMFRNMNTPKTRAENSAKLKIDFKS